MPSSHSSASSAKDDDVKNGHPSGQASHASSEIFLDSNPAEPIQVQSPADEESDTTQSPKKTPLPLQKRRRVTRACDECRRKKIKCDGKQPCTHCTVYSYDCTYDQPSNRRRNPAPQYIEALEHRLQKAEMIIRTALPGVELDDPKFDAHSIEQILASAKHKISATTTKSTNPPESTESTEEDQLESMITNTGSLDIDDRGNWDYHGNSSGVAFMRKLKPQFGDITLPDPRYLPYPRYSQILESPKSTYDSPFDAHSPHHADLPPRETALELCRNTLDNCCALMRLVHKPSFYGRLHNLYDKDPEHYTNADRKFLPLLYSVIAVGCLYSKREGSDIGENGYEKAVERGYHYFVASRDLIDITDTRDLTALQTICFMALFLQSTAKLGTCYSHVGIALRAATRLGLHRNVIANFDPIERECRKRIFWTIRNMDAYVSAMIGLPQMLNEDDIDQELPLELDDECITKDGILSQPSDRFPLIRASNAHCRLVSILKKVVRYIYPLKIPDTGVTTTGRGIMISHAKIQELERELQQWMSDLPMELRPSEDVPPDLGRVQQHLRMAYAHVQLMTYRPFLHYVSSGCESRGVDKRTFACAAACISISRNIVHIITEMKRRGLLMGAYWFQVYTTYIAILSLCFFVIENPNSHTGAATLKDALEGRDTLTILARSSPAADRCSRSLEPLFNRLPDKLRDRKSSAQSTPNSRKRHMPQFDPTTSLGSQSTPSIPSTSRSETPKRASTSPSHSASESGRRATPKSMQDQPGTQKSPVVSNDRNPSWKTPITGVINSNSVPAMAFQGEPLQASPQQATFGAQVQNQNIPDLKAVMFPSDNPFAYGNQAISTLERTQQDMDSQTAFDSEDTFMANGAPLPSSMSYDVLYHPPAAYMQQPNAPATGPPMNGQHYPTLSQMDNSMANADLVTVSGLGEGGFWQQMNAGGRTGFTPGIASTVNFDDLFGNEQWNSGWMQSGYPQN